MNVIAQTKGVVFLKYINDSVVKKEIKGWFIVCT